MLGSLTAKIQKLIPKVCGQEDRTGLSAFSEDGHLPVLTSRVQILPTKTAQLGNAKACIIQSFQYQPIAGLGSNANI